MRRDDGRPQPLDGDDAREPPWQALVDSLPWVVWLKDRHGRLLAANTAYARELGVASPAALIGKTVLDLLPAERAAQDEAADQMVLASGGGTLAEEAGADARGRTRWREVWRAPVRRHGEVVGVAGCAVDVTDKRMAEIDLKKSLAFVQGVIDAFPDVLFEGTASGRYLNAWTKNPELLAASREHMLGRTFDEVLSPESAAVARAAFEETSETGVSFGRVIAIDTEVGRRYFELSVSRMNQVDDTADEEPHYITVSRDVTERRELQAALERQEREFRTLVEHSPDLIARFDTDQRCVYANPALADRAGSTSAELSGQHAAAMFGSVAGEEVRLWLQDACRSGETNEYELQWTDAEGRQAWILLSLTPEFDHERSVVSVLTVGRDITELRAYQERIRRMAFYDTLTGLPNRSLFTDRLAQMIADATWHRGLAGVMILDLDRFKAVNDSLGHGVGDELLEEAAARLRRSVRAYDTVARLGGDEFGLLLPQIRSADDLGRVASKALSAIDAAFALGGKEIFVTCSIGIAVFPGDSSDPDELVRFADTAMYSAKHAGRNDFRFYSPSLTVVAQERLAIETELRRALEREQLRVEYQPKVALGSGQVTGSEALLRWQHPTLGNVPPDTFIPAAEDAGQIIEIGRWVLREACTLAARLNTEGRPPHTVAVNLSPRQLRTSDFVPSFEDILAETECDASWIELEITERLLLDEEGAALDALRALRRTGSTVAIDDFGTGYSALHYLTHFPIDTIKIDRSFTRRVTVDRHGAELVRAIVSIAHCLEMGVVAEGVERVEEGEFLRANGCDFAQGFLYSRSVPGPVLIELAERGDTLPPGRPATT